MIVTTLARWCGLAITLVSLLIFAVWWRNAGLATATHAELSRVLPNVALFAAFAAHHSLFARRFMKAFVVRLVPAHLERTVYVGAASLLLIMMSVLWKPVGGVVYSVSGWIGVLFYALQALGVAVGLLAARHFSVTELVGMVPAMPAAQLGRSGPYRVVRHPLYTSLVLMLAATPHMTGDRFLFVVSLLVYVAIAMPLEERSLTAQFGDDYRLYRARVRWRLIPYIH